MKATHPLEKISRIVVHRIGGAKKNFLSISVFILFFYYAIINTSQIIWWFEKDFQFFYKVLENGTGD